MDSMDNIREPFEALEQQTKQLRHHTQMIKRRLRWWRVIVCSVALELILLYGILCLRGKEATAIGPLRFADLQLRPTEVLDVISLTVEELRQLVPPFEVRQRFAGKWAILV